MVTPKSLTQARNSSDLKAFLPVLQPLTHTSQAFTGSLRNPDLYGLSFISGIAVALKVPLLELEVGRGELSG